MRSGIWCAFLVVCAACAGSPAPAKAPASPAPPAVVAPPRSGPYLGETAGSEPAIFGRGLVSRQYQELNAAFSPSGDELFYTLADPGRSHYTLLHVRRGADGVWGEPAVAPFSGRYADADPIFSPDGARLYFISRRPVDAGTAPKDFDIWSVERTASGWGTPKNLGAPINTPDDEYYVSVTRTGVVYWSRKGDIYRAEPGAGGYRASALPEAVNSKSDEFDPFVAADESYVIFASFRPDSVGSADLYVSFRDNGVWQPAKNLGPSVNSKAFDYCPIMSPDGSHFFFTSYRTPQVDPATRPPATLESLLTSFEQIENGMGNVYWMKSEFLETLRTAAPR
jgi:WD40-like Beta Propeller Repeat